MKFGRMLALSLAALLIAVPAVHAQDEDMGELTTKRPRKQTQEEENNDPSRSGVLLGVGALYALDSIDNVGMALDGSGGFSAHLGYRFNKWVSSEVRVDRFVQFDGDAANPAPPPNRIDVGEINGWYLGLDQKVYILHGRFQPFALVGLGLLDFETTNALAANPKKTDDGVAMRFGGGLDIYATNKIVVTADVAYLLGMGDIDNYGVTVFGLGFLYRP
jgi:hypothetical protein